MFTFQFVQPAHHGQHLAIGQFEYEEGRMLMCDVALVRLAPSLVERLTPELARLPRDWADQTDAIELTLPIVERDPAQWESHGLSVLVHQPGISGQHTLAATTALLAHPLWLATREASEIAAALPDLPPGRPRRRTTL